MVGPRRFPRRSSRSSSRSIDMRGPPGSARGSPSATRSRSCCLASSSERDRLRRRAAPRAAPRRRAAVRADRRAVGRDPAALIASRATSSQRAGYSAAGRHRATASEYTLLFRARRARQPPAADAAADDRQRTSTSALTRPLLQDFVFAPDVFVGGPAEVAYYAQIAPLHELLGIADAARGAARPRARRAEAGRAGDVRALRHRRRSEIFASADAILAEREPEGVAEIAAHRRGREARAGGADRRGSASSRCRPSTRWRAHRPTRSATSSITSTSSRERAIQGLVRKDRERYAGDARARGHVLSRPPRAGPRRGLVCATGRPGAATSSTACIDEVEPDSASFKMAVFVMTDMRNRGHPLLRRASGRHRALLRRDGREVRQGRPARRHRSTSPAARWARAARRRRASGKRRPPPRPSARPSASSSTSATATCGPAASRSWSSSSCIRRRRPRIVVVLVSRRAPSRPRPHRPARHRRLVLRRPARAGDRRPRASAAGGALLPAELHVPADLHRRRDAALEDQDARRRRVQIAVPRPELERAARPSSPTRSSWR